MSRNLYGKMMVIVSQSVQEKITVKQVALYLVITFLVSWSLDELAKDIS